MLPNPEPRFAHNDPLAYWSPDCWRFTRDCAHLVESLDSPSMPLNHWQFQAATWSKSVLQVTMNTGERFQHFSVSRSMAVAFVRSPDPVMLKGHRFQAGARALTSGPPARSIRVFSVTEGNRFERVRGREDVIKPGDQREDAGGS